MELEILDIKPYKHRKDSVIMDMGFKDNGLYVRGDAYIPVDMEYATVFCHGVGANHEISSRFIKSFVPRDMGVLKITYPGHNPVGGEFDPELNERYTHLLLDELPKLYFTENVILSGHSAGGYNALRTAASRDDVKGLVLFDPAYDLYDAFTKKPLYRFCAKHPRITGPFVKWHVNRGWVLEGTDALSEFRIEDFPRLEKNIRDEPLAGDYTSLVSCPVLIYHGTEDKRVPYTDSERLSDDLSEKGVDVKLVKLEGASHNPLTNGDCLGKIRFEFGSWLREIDKPGQGKTRLWNRMKKTISDYRDAKLSRRLRQMQMYLDLPLSPEIYLDGLSLEFAEPLSGSRPPED